MSPRLFTAVELPDAVRAAVAAAAWPLLDAVEGGRRGATGRTARRATPGEPGRVGAGATVVRRVDPGNLHVTVRFLGDVDAAAMDALRAALAAAAAEVAAGEAAVRGFSAFPAPSWPRVVWGGVEEPGGAISALERAVSRRIAALGFPPEDRPFTPHVTVARIDPRGAGRGPGSRDPRPPRAFVAPPPEPLGPPFPVRELTLFRSDAMPPDRGPPGRGPRGPRYTVLDRFPLAARSA